MAVVISTFGVFVEQLEVAPQKRRLRLWKMGILLEPFLTELDVEVGRSDDDRGQDHSSEAVAHIQQEEHDGVSSGARYPWLYH